MRRSLALATALTALVTLAPQVTALLLLTPGEFGRFSMLYLVFAFGLSIGISTISEPWHRKILDQEEILGWREYASASVALSLATSCAGLALAFALQLDAVTAIIGALACGLGVYRSAARYFLAEKKSWSRIIATETLFLACFLVAAGVALTLRWPPLDSVLFAWFTAGTAMLLTTPPNLPSIRALHRWVVHHRKTLPHLLGDSLLMDVGAIFTPALIAPVLGLQAFGTYRAVSNVAAPVRLILNPLRPQISQDRRNSNASSRTLVIAVAAGILMGLAAGAVLALIGLMSLDVGVLTSLAPFAPAVTLTVASNFVGHLYYIRARSSASAARLMTARIIQTVLVTALPFVGAWYASLSGAIWALAVSGGLTAVTWIVADQRAR